MPLAVELARGIEQRRNSSTSMMPRGRRRSSGSRVRRPRATFRDTKPTSSASSSIDASVRSVLFMDSFDRVRSGRPIRGSRSGLPASAAARIRVFSAWMRRRYSLTFSGVMSDGNNSPKKGVREAGHEYQEEPTFRELATDWLEARKHNPAIQQLRPRLRSAASIRGQRRRGRAWLWLRATWRPRVRRVPAPGCR